MYVATPRCIYALLLLLLLWCPDERIYWYTYCTRTQMMHRRLTTAGIEVAPIMKTLKAATLSKGMYCVDQIRVRQHACQRRLLLHCCRRRRRRRR